MADMKSNKSTTPRVEAIPLRWSDKDAGDQSFLTETQQGAAIELWKFFKNYYLDHAPKRSRYDDSRRGLHRSRIERALPVIDDQRRNQVLLLDGARGSGKTALLVTLLDAWNRAVTNNLRREGTGLADVCDARGRVIPVGLLDLRALPKDTSLLLQIAGQLRGIAEELGIHRTQTEPPISPHDPRVEEGQHDWHLFLAAAASTEQQMRRRSAELDPEAFAAELHDSESDRIHLGDRFAKVIDRLVEAEEKRRRVHMGGRRKVDDSDTRDTPVFVIAIDDADMNPARLGECFELLNTLVHPRLVFILTGKTDLFLAALRAQFLGELRRPLAGAQLADDERARLRDVSESFSLAQRYFDKLIPPPHRCGLKELPPKARIDQVRVELDALKLGEASIGTVFKRLPALGSLLPGHLRELADFRAELHELARLGGEGPQAFLLLIKDRVKRQLRDEGADDFDVDELVSKIKGSIFDEEPLTRLTNWPLVTLTKDYSYAVREEQRGHDLTVFHYRATFYVCPRPKDKGELPTNIEDTLDDRILQLALLIEYIAPFVSTPLEPFESSLLFRVPLPGNDYPPLSTRLTFPGFGFAGFNWPQLTMPMIPTSGWRWIEVDRLWRAVLETVVDGSPFDDNAIELAALNYVNVFAHAASASLETPDPDILQPTVETREDTWREVITRAMNRHNHALAPTADLLRFAHPESRLGADAARRVLSAWISVHSPDKGMEEYTSIDAILMDSEIARWNVFTTIADKNGKSARMLHTLLADRFPAHPWTERLAGLVDQDALSPLRAALERVPVERLDSAKWLPATAAGYLAYGAEVSLSRAGPNQLGPLVDAINYYVESSSPQLTLYRAWQSARPKQNKALTWNDFVVRPSFPPVITHERPATPSPAPTATEGLEWLAYLGDVQDLDGEDAHTAGFYRLVHDFIADRRRGDRNTRSAGWRLLQTYREEEESTEPHSPWPAVQWQTYVDSEAIVTRWREFFDGEELSPDELGVLARRYTEAQIRTFESRTLTPIDTPPMSWQEVFEYARDQLERAPADFTRTHALRNWIEELKNFSNSDAGLSFIEGAAVFVAFLEIISPLVEIKSSRPRVEVRVLRNLAPLDKAERFENLDKAERFEEIVPVLPTFRDQRAFAGELRARFGREVPGLFEPPPCRLAAVERFEASLKALSLDASSKTSYQPNVGAYLSADLSGQCRSIYTGTLQRISDALGSGDGLDARLYAAWRAARSEARATVRYDGERLVVEGAYKIEEGTSEGDSISESGLSYRFFTGAINSPIDESLASILHALLHDVSADGLSDVQAAPTLRWPLASVVCGDFTYQPWPAAQWPTRFDLQLQLRSWLFDAERRKDSALESASARARFFIASTVHIMRQRTLFEEYQGGWSEIIQEAYDVATATRHVPTARSKAFHAWYEQIPRFALPRAGLGVRHAADILVRFYDITKIDPRPQLRGRIQQVNDRKLPFDVPDDHPTVQVVQCETEDQVRETLDRLRKEHELG